MTKNLECHNPHEPSQEGVCLPEKMSRRDWLKASVATAVVATLGGAAGWQLRRREGAHALRTNSSLMEGPGWKVGRIQEEQRALHPEISGRIRQTTLERVYSVALSSTLTPALRTEIVRAVEAAETRCSLPGCSLHMVQTVQVDQHSLFVCAHHGPDQEQPIVATRPLLGAQVVVQLPQGNIVLQPQSESYERYTATKPEILEMVFVGEKDISDFPPNTVEMACTAALLRQYVDRDLYLHTAVISTSVVQGMFRLTCVFPQGVPKERVAWAKREDEKDVRDGKVRR